MTTFFIAPTGNDGNSGAANSPWLTIQKFMGAASDGDICNVAAGTYSTWSAGQNTGASVTIVGAGANTTVIDYTGVPSFWNNSGIVAITGLQFKAMSPSAVSGTGAFAGKFSFTNCIFNNFVANSNGSFWEGNANGDSLTMISCALVSSTTQANQSLFLPRGNKTITVNLTNCSFFSNVGDSSTCTVFGDTAGGNVTATLINSIFANLNGTPKAWFQPGSSATYTFTASSNCDLFGYTGGPTIANSISADPLFVDPANSNFSLQSASPCLAAGEVI